MLALFLLPALLIPQGGPTSADQLAAVSSYVFRGRVVRSRASTMPQVAAGTNTAVVLVEEVYHAAATMPNMRGKEITLNLAQDAAAGRSYIFFANIWLYGTSLAAREAGRLDTRADAGAERKLVQDAFQSKQDRALRQRIDRAALVVLGKVLRTQPITRNPRWPVSEHDPQWWIAIIQVEGTAKGQSPREQTVVFPNSTDELWIDSPKFKAGQEGVWILQRDTQEKVPTVYAVPGYTALDQMDFQPRQAWDKIRQLAGNANP